MTFIDQGYSGATLVRPALEQLRDVVAQEGVDRLYVLSPDRLARRYAYQVLLIDEFANYGGETRYTSPNDLGERKWPKTTTPSPRCSSGTRRTVWAASALFSRLDPLR